MFQCGPVTQGLRKLSATLSAYQDSLVFFFIAQGIFHLFLVIWPDQIFHIYSPAVDHLV